jgi:cytosine/adenosine deaminase-related metal-dependent hydrolase
MSEDTLKIDNAAYAITVDPERRVIQDAAVIIAGQRITHVGKAADLASVGATRVVDARGFVVTPAFVNGHMHISYAHAVRGIFPDDFVGQRRLVDVFRLQSAMTEDEEYATSLLAITELLKGGTVTFVDPGSTKFLDACMQAYADSRCRIVTGESLIDEPDERALPRYSTEEALARTEQLIRRYDHHLDDRVRVWAMPFGNDNSTPALLTGLKRLADDYGTGITIHHSSTPSVRQRIERTHGTTPIGLLFQIGALGPNMLLAHVNGIDDSEVELIAASGSGVAICPGTLAKEGAGVGDRKLPELLERGVNVALGADSANSSNYLDMVRVINAAAVGFKDGRRSHTVVPAEQALEMATLLGARALGLGSAIGSIEVGKKADLVLFDTRRAEWRSLFDPVNNLVYAADGRSVHTVIADGKVVVENHQALFVDEARLADQVQSIGETLLQRTGRQPSRGRWPML